jgi:hypothetical protein
MGRYLALRMRFKGRRLEAPLLRLAFSSDAFRPTCLGAIEPLPSGGNWLLSGYGLESFTSHWSWRDKAGQPQVDFCGTPDVRQREYLQLIKTWIVRHDIPQLSTSPFEVIDELAGATFLRSPALQEGALLECQEWLHNRPRALVDLYGVFNVAVSDEQERDWANAFQSLYTPMAGRPYIGVPFIKLQASPNERSEEWSELVLFSESTIWLHHSKALRGMVSDDQADINTHNLAKLARALLNSGVPIVSLELRTESRTFQSNLDRIRRIFSDYSLHPDVVK